ncbi:MAG: methylated-DNA--[protein]-cysteine S-methyltransferase [Flavobacteriales bacterium]|nr:methylated-DNA--[protein]-cysteine S-methyltransferase [Flavobacteriales bacterium]
MKLQHPNIVFQTVRSPLGRLKLGAHPAAIVSLEFVDDSVEVAEQATPVLSLAVSQLIEYFGGTRKVFSVPLDPTGTHFQMNVWEELQKIPFGKTMSYQELSRRLGDVKLIRAVAGANGRNPIPILIPCHRIIGKDGSLTGYSGGILNKKWLLQHESQVVQNQLFT